MNSSPKSGGPLIVQSDRVVLLDVHHELADEAREVLASFAELVKSPENLHTYRISPLSLWNAAASGIDPDDVVSFLGAYARNRVAKAVRNEVGSLMRRFGRLILRRRDDKLLLMVSHDLWEDVISLKAIEDMIISWDGDICEIVLEEAYRGEIKRVLTRAGMPVEDLAGYVEGDSLEINLTDRLGVDDDAPPFDLRPYQRDAAAAFYQDGMERGGNGVVVLPCGSGKTIVGIGVMDLYQTKTLILTNNRTSVRQWVREVCEKTDLAPDQVAEYSADVKNIASVTATTYQMLTYRSREDDTFPHFDMFMKSNWGLVIYDEVHLLPAPVFRMCAELQARRRLGLTATLVREDGREDDVFSLIGPKRFDMPWRRLERGGFIAEAKCVEMRVPLTPYSAEKYELSNRRGQYRLASENPLKLKVLQALLARHAGERVLIIGMYLQQLAIIRTLVGADLITSRTSQDRREELYGQFRTGEISTLIVSKVANFAVDLPDANIAIQVSGTFGSRQEEAQRVGRILRPKAEGTETVFYTLVSTDTSEVRFADNRQLFMTEQGYSYTIVDAQTEFSHLDWSDSEDEMVIIDGE